MKLNIEQYLGQSVARKHVLRNTAQGSPDAMTLAGLDHPYPGPLFDLCGDGDLMSLSFSGINPFIDWLGWSPTNINTIKREFLTWVRPAQYLNESTPGYVSNPCADPNGVDAGGCDFTLTDFGLLRRKSPTRDLTEDHMLQCITQPRLRLDGSRVDTNREWDMILSTEVLMTDLFKMVVNGNKSTGGHFAGLESLVNTGYVNSNGQRCHSMDSIVIDWNANPLAGGNGITWNGQAISNSVELITILQAVIRRIRWRISLAPVLAARRISVGDMIIVLPTAFVDAVLNAYTCWKVCGNDWTRMDSYEARNFRDSLNGGMFGAGRLFFDSFEIPIMPYDWELLKSGTTFDMYVLVNQVGASRLIEGQHKDMNVVASKGEEFSATDRGLLLSWYKRQNTCENMIVEMQPRLLMWAPWAQARIQDVKASVVGGPYSPDPDSSFFIESSFIPFG
jgi:hypothetical protein